jgi:hypothetical protein
MPYPPAAASPSATAPAVLTNRASPRSAVSARWRAARHSCWVSSCVLQTTSSSRAMPDRVTAEMVRCRPTTTETATHPQARTLTAPGRGCGGSGTGTESTGRPYNGAPTPGPRPAGPSADRMVPGALRRPTSESTVAGAPEEGDAELG